MVTSNESTASTTTIEMENQVEGRLLLDVVVTKGAAILKLFTSEDNMMLGSLSCPESWPSHCQRCHLTQPQLQITMSESLLLRVDS